MNCFADLFQRTRHIRDRKNRIVPAHNVFRTAVKPCNVILGDLVCDCMDAYRLEDQKKLHSEQDSPAMTAMMKAYLNRASGADYKTAVALECRKQLEAIVKAGEAVKYAVAIKDKDFLWDILYDKIYDHVKRAEVSQDVE